jgi:hypothetical protein
MEQLLFVDPTIANKTFSYIKKRLLEELKTSELDIDEQTLEEFNFRKLAEMEVITIAFYL